MKYFAFFLAAFSIFFLNISSSKAADAVETLGVLETKAYPIWIEDSYSILDFVIEDDTTGKVLLCFSQDSPVSGTLEDIVNQSILCEGPNEYGQTLEITTSFLDIHNHKYYLNVTNIDTSPVTYYLSFYAVEYKKGFYPTVGLWYNPSQEGHGYHIAFYGDKLAVVYYTYEEDTTPTWYLAIGDLNDNVFEAELMKYQYSGQDAYPYSVGNIKMIFSDKNKGEAIINIDNHNIRENIEKFYFDYKMPPKNLTALWYDPEHPGYGYTIENQGDKVVIVAYYYGSWGEPRWSLALTDLGNPMDYHKVDALTFLGPCPYCQGSAKSYNGGTIEFSFETTNDGEIGVDLYVPPPANEAWIKPKVYVQRISN